MALSWVQKRGWFTVYFFLYLPIVLVTLHSTFSKHPFCCWFICLILDTQDKQIKISDLKRSWKDHVSQGKRKDRHCSVQVAHSGERQ